MGDVMARVPAVMVHQVIDGDLPNLRVDKRARELFNGQRAQHSCPAGVERIEHRERYGDGQPLIWQLRKRLLIVRFDRRVVLGNGQLHPDVRIDVTVGHMMDNLPDGPPARPIWCVELRFG